eukprot:scaffold113322_cov48-Phaeocystis_antarctica.AAC.1
MSVCLNRVGSSLNLINLATCFSRHLVVCKGRKFKIQKCRAGALHRACRGPSWGGALHAELEGSSTASWLVTATKRSICP